jgi:hypothetical protein
MIRPVDMRGTTMRTKAAMPLACALLLAARDQTGNGGAPAASSETAAGPTLPAQPPRPHRRPGLWELRTSTEGDEGVQRTQICLDAGTDPKIALWGAQATPGCNHSEAVRLPDGSWRFRTSCWLGSGGQLSTSGVVTGDLASRYIVRAEQTRSAAEAPQLNRTIRVTTEAQRIGDCPAGWRGGDMSMGPMRINALQVGRPR